MNQNPQNLAKIKVNRKEMEEGSQTVKKKKKNKFSLLLLASQGDHWCPGGIKNRPLRPPPQGLCSVWWAPEEVRNVFFLNTEVLFLRKMYHVACSYFRLFKDVVGLSLSPSWDGDLEAEAGTQTVLRNFPSTCPHIASTHRAFPMPFLLPPKILTDLRLRHEQNLKKKICGGVGILCAAKIKDHCLKEEVLGMLMWWLLDDDLMVSC